MKALEFADLPALLERVSRGECPPDTAHRAIEGLVRRAAVSMSNDLFVEYKADLAGDLGAAILDLVHHERG